MELRVNYSPETEQNIDLVEQFNVMEELAGPQVCILAYLHCPNGCIVVCTFHTVRSWIQIVILTTNYRNGIGIGIRV